MTTVGGASKRGSHRLAEAVQCPRKWYLHNGRGISPKKPPIYFLEGTLVHVALAYHWAAKLPVKPDWYTRETVDEALLKAGTGFPDAIKLAKDIAAAYARHYGPNDPWTPVAIEQEWFASLGDLRKMLNPAAASQDDDSEQVSCRIDLLIRTNGKLWAVDYKTTAHGTGSRLPTFNPEGEFGLRWQFVLQAAILRKNFGAEFGGIVVERVYKKSPYDFDRSVAPIPRRVYLDLPNVIAEAARAERKIAQDAAAAMSRGADMEVWMPPGHYWHCFPYGKPCEYRQICVSETDVEMREVVRREYKVE